MEEDRDKQRKGLILKFLWDFSPEMPLKSFIVTSSIVQTNGRIGQEYAVQYDQWYYIMYRHLVITNKPSSFQLALLRQIKHGSTRPFFRSTSSKLYDGTLNIMGQPTERGGGQKNDFFKAKTNKKKFRKGIQTGEKVQGLKKN